MAFMDEAGWPPSGLRPFPQSKFAKHLMRGHQEHLPKLSAPAFLSKMHRALFLLPTCSLAQAPHLEEQKAVYPVPAMPTPLRHGAGAE